MEKELISFIESNNLQPFSKKKTAVKLPTQTIFKTKDSKSVHNRALQIISNRFIFPETSNLLNFFDTFPELSQIIKRQEFFKSLQQFQGDFLKNLKQPRPFWNPDYGIVVVTEEDLTFQTLKKLGCNVKFLVDETDLVDLERYDIVQVIDCENFLIALEKLPQAVFLKSTEEAYLERYLRVLSGWKENLEILNQVKSPEINILVTELSSLLYLLNKTESKNLTREIAEEKLEEVKSNVSKKVKEQNVSGDLLLEVLNKGILPLELKKIVKEAIQNSGLPENIFLQQIPVQLDEKELEKELRHQDLNKFANIAEEIKKNSKKLIQIPAKLRELEIQIILYDFKSTVSKWMQNKTFPAISKSLSLEASTNEFLENPSPITFFLDDQNRCSMLTGANSGGKTTLIEHIIQAISYTYLGLPTQGKFSTPIFTELYYFAKNKGSMNKGAFETLLTQLSKVSPGNKTLILADEIEAVTEPGVAGKIIAASAEYFVKQGCFIVFATHLGHEIQKILPQGARIDGIEAKGLDEFNELIVDHNPVIGKLASSTPELIVEKMAKISRLDYLKFLNESLRKS
jgi:hypothetical protein